jgi:hypothetical protein
MPSSKRVDTETVRVTPATLKKLKIAAIEHDTTVHELVEKYVAERADASSLGIGFPLQEIWCDFSLNVNLELGTPCVIEMSLSPSSDLQLSEIICNAPVPGFVSFLTMQVSGFPLTIGNSADAFIYSGKGRHISGHMKKKVDRAVFAGTYSGLIPPAYPVGRLFSFTVTLRGVTTVS